METNSYIRHENIYHTSGGCSALPPKTAQKYVLGVGNLLARTGRFELHDAGRLCGVPAIMGNIRGVSVQIQSNLNKSFSHSIWSCWALSPSKYSPPHFIHRSQRFFQFWKHSWNACFGILRSSASEFSLNSSTRLKSSSCQDGYQRGEEKEVHWSKVWWGRRLGDKRCLMFGEKFTDQKRGMNRSVVMMAQPLSPPHQAFFSSLTLRRLMSYIYGAPILDVSGSHTTTQHSR